MRAFCTGYLIGSYILVPWIVGLSVLEPWRSPHEHEWTDWWSGTYPDGRQARWRACLHCEETEEEPV